MCGWCGSIPQDPNNAERERRSEKVGGGGAGRGRKGKKGEGQRERAGKELAACERDVTTVSAMAWGDPSVGRAGWRGHTALLLLA